MTTTMTTILLIGSLMVVLLIALYITRDPRYVYIIFNDEEHVGSFFQAIYYSAADAEVAMDELHDRDLKQQLELWAMLKENVEDGEYPHQYVDLTQPISSRLNLTLEKYDTKLQRIVEETPPRMYV